MSWISLNCSDGWKAFEGGFSSSVLVFLVLPLTFVLSPQRVNDREGVVCVYVALPP